MAHGQEKTQLMEIRLCLPIKPQDFNTVVIFLLALVLRDACDRFSGPVSSVRDPCLLAAPPASLHALLHLLVGRPSSLELGFYPFASL